MNWVLLHVGRKYILVRVFLQSTFSVICSDYWRIQAIQKLKPVSIQHLSQPYRRNNGTYLAYTKNGKIKLLRTKLYKRLYP